MVVAAGNNEVNACQESPASASAALTVGSVGQSGSISRFSNFGGCVDLFAPGEGIVSVWKQTKNGLAIAAGTSMAAPHAAGVKALYLATRSYSPQNLDAELKNSATKGQIDNLPAGNVNFLLYNNPPLNNKKTEDIKKEENEDEDDADEGGEKEGEKVEEDDVDEDNNEEKKEEELDEYEDDDHLDDRRYDNYFVKGSGADAEDTDLIGDNSAYTLVEALKIEKAKSVEAEYNAKAKEGVENVLGIIERTAVLAVQQFFQ